MAERHGLRIHMVSNAWIRLPARLDRRSRGGSGGPDAADDWIAERVEAGDIVVTQDIPLASRALKKGARAIGNTGKSFNDASIGMALAMRELSQHLRETGESRGFNAAFTKADRSRFLQALEQAVQEGNGGRDGEAANRIIALKEYRGHNPVGIGRRGYIHGNVSRHARRLVGGMGVEEDASPDAGSRA